MTITIRKIGIIGAGQMGCGIAHVCAIAGHKVTLCDISREHLQRGLNAIGTNMDRYINKNQITKDEKTAALTQIESATDYNTLSDCDIIIEAVIEDEVIKCQVFDDLRGKIAPNVLLASNTSSLSITKIASATDHPERFVGMHFMNPVPTMKLVELIRGIATSDETFEMTRNFVTGLGKTAILSGDLPAFMVNRMLMPMINEAIYTLYEGVGSIENIDDAMRLGTNHPMGPLQLADFIGLDTCLSIMQSLHEGFADSKYRPCPLLVKYVEAKWLGRKTKRGFYDYNGEKPIPTR